MSEFTAKKRGLTPLARILGHSSFAQSPDWFTTAPIGAMKQLLEKVGWTTHAGPERVDADLFEINEAFATVAMAAMKDLELAAVKVPPWRSMRAWSSSRCIRN